MSCLIIEYPRDQWCGGLGDRMVGLVSAVLLARGTGKQLLIKWDAPSLHGLIDLGPWNFYNRPGAQKNALVLNTIDQRFKYENLLSQENVPHIWHGRNIILRCNHEIASFWYRNPHRGSNGSDFEADARTVYQELFTTYLHLTFALQGPALQGPYWACQIRTGDVALGVGNHCPIPRVEEVVLAVVTFLQAQSILPPISPQVLYVSSDHSQVTRLLEQGLNTSPTNPTWQVIDWPMSRVHLERSTLSSMALQALITDVLFLSRAAPGRLIISACSNYGRLIALLRAVDDTIWGFRAAPYLIELVGPNSLYTKEPIRTGPALSSPSLALFVMNRARVIRGRAGNKRAGNRRQGLFKQMRNKTLNRNPRRSRVQSRSKARSRARTRSRSRSHATRPHKIKK